MTRITAQHVTLAVFFDDCYCGFEFLEPKQHTNKYSPKSIFNHAQLCENLDLVKLLERQTAGRSVA